MRREYEMLIASLISVFVFIFLIGICLFLYEMHRSEPLRLNKRYVNNYEEQRQEDKVAKSKSDIIQAL